MIQARSRDRSSVRARSTSAAVSVAAAGAKGEPCRPRLLRLHRTDLAHDLDRVREAGRAAEELRRAAQRGESRGIDAGAGSSAADRPAQQAHHAAVAGDLEVAVVIGLTPVDQLALLGEQG